MNKILVVALASGLLAGRTVAVADGPPETYMRSRIDAAVVATVEGRRYVQVVHGWAVTNANVDRDPPAVEFLVDDAYGAGIGPAEAYNRPDVCAVVEASWGWRCGALRTYRSATDWWGVVPRDLVFPPAGSGLTSVGIRTVGPGILVEGLAPGRHTVRAWTWTAAYLGADGSMPAEPLLGWSNAIEFYL